VPAPRAVSKTEIEAIALGERVARRARSRMQIGVHVGAVGWIVLHHTLVAHALPRKGPSCAPVASRSAGLERALRAQIT